MSRPTLLTSMLEFDTPPFRLSGVVVGSLMNHASALSALGAAVNEAPYKAPPRGPVLYVKPRNTLACSGADVAVPATAGELEVGASLGLVIGRTASRVSEHHAFEHLAGYTLVADLSVPHDSFYRPSIRFKALDGSCLIGPRIALAHEIANPDDLSIRVSLDGTTVQAATTSNMVRSVARLLADVSEFMTLRPGDILMLGIARGAPRARSGQRFAIECATIGRIEGRLVNEVARTAA